MCFFAFLHLFLLFDPESVFRTQNQGWEKLAANDAVLRVLFLALIIEQQRICSFPPNKIR